MEYEYRKLINDLASDIVKEYDIKIPINDIESVVSKLGGLVETDYTKSEYADGIIEKHNNSFKIIIPKITVERRKKQEIATQIGHLFLHMQYQIDSTVWNSYPERAHYSNKQERQAKDFGLALLMTINDFKEVVNRNLENDKVNITEIAKHFGLSHDMVIMRGRFLWLID